MLKDRITHVRDRIETICKKKNISFDTITLVAVTKTVDPQRIQEAISFGIGHIGESKVQEAEKKFSNLKLERITKHLVGHLQSNKVKKAVQLFNLIQSLDSVELAKEIDRQAEGIGKVQQCLMEVKVSGEESKFGLQPEKVEEVLDQTFRLKHLCIRGLMAMAPYFEDPQGSRPYFASARKLFDRLRLKYGAGFDVLSMGMSNDFEVALEEGSTMVRIGTAIFGE